MSEDCYIIMLKSHLKAHFNPNWWSHLKNTNQQILVSLRGDTFGKGIKRGRNPR